MTDEQIIKALEYCFTRGFDESTCYECPFYTATAKCTEDLRENALDLIKRQKAKIESLEKELMKCKLEKELLYNVSVEKQNIAIKEFAERLKEFMHNKFKALDEYEFEYITERDIDNLLKETEGE